MAAAGCRSPFNPPPLPELALFGLIVQPPRELTASKSKENQGKRLLFPCIPLVESGLFNGLWRKNKKNSLPAQLACQVAREHSAWAHTHRLSHPASHRLSVGFRRKIYLIFLYLSTNWTKALRSRSRLDLEAMT
jgi:hypothetical protein